MSLIHNLMIARAAFPLSTSFALHSKSMRADSTGRPHSHPSHPSGFPRKYLIPPPPLPSIHFLSLSAYRFTSLALISVSILMCRAGRKTLSRCQQRRRSRGNLISSSGYVKSYFGCFLWARGILKFETANR